LKLGTFIVLFVLLLTACAPSPTPVILVPPTAPTLTPAAALPTATIPPTPTSTPPAVPSLNQLKNATYTLSAANGLQVTLVDGQFDIRDSAKNTRASGQLIAPVTYGDVDGDGVTDAVVIIAVNTGGSGTFHELIVLLASKGQAASRMMGDRISEKQLGIKDGKITLDYLRAGPKDGLCCPSQLARTVLQYKNGELLVVSDEELPAVSPVK
jgi:hypothetical protein